MYTIYLTTRCNYRCSYCYEDYGHETDMSQNQIINVVDYIFKYDKNQKINIGFMGGEPLLKKDIIFLVVDYIKKKYPDRNIKYYMTSNASLITRDFVDFMKNNNFELRISLDGSRSTNNQNRYSKNKIDYYGEIFNHLKFMSETKLKYSIRMTVAKNAITDLYDNIKYLYETFSEPINLIFDINMIIDDTVEDLIRKEIKKIENYYVSKNLCSNKSGLTIDQFDGKFVNVLSNFENRFGMCSAGISSFNFMPDGKIYPCGFLTNNDKFSIGDINEPINTCISKRLAISLVEKEETKCNDCKIKFFCHGMKCGYKNYIRTSKINVPSDSTCKIEKIFYSSVMNILNCFLNDENTDNILGRKLKSIIKSIDYTGLQISDFGELIKNKVEII